MFELFLVVSFLCILNTVGASDLQGNGESKGEESGSHEQGDDHKHFVSKNPAQLSLGCIFFKNIGCDMECFVTADAFGLLGAGVCIKGDRCDCGFALDPTLEGLWHEKFANSDKILEEIKSNHKQANEIHMILAQPYKTGQQTRIALLKYLTEEQKDSLRVTDTTPASRIEISPTVCDIPEVYKHVGLKLPIAIKPYEDELAAANEYTTSLGKTLDDAKQNNMEIFHQIVHMVRRLRNNKSLNDILTKYLTKNHIEEIVDQTFVSGIDRISYVVVEKLIKKVDQGTIQLLFGWFKTRFTSFLNRFRTNENDQPITEVLATSGPISRVWRDEGITLRYRRNPQGDINLAWVKESDRVCIFKSATDVVNQSWLFDGEVFISLSRSSLGSISQYWDFGEVAYEYYKDSKTAGQSYGKWSNEKANEEILKNYQKKIEAWCTQNDFLIARNVCIIYENIDTPFR